MTLREIARELALSLLAFLGLFGTCVALIVLFDVVRLLKGW